MSDAKKKLEESWRAVERICRAAGFERDDGGCYSSREGGNGTDCVPSRDTIKLARKLAGQIIAMGCFEVEIDTCDEWVMIAVTASKL